MTLGDAGAYITRLPKAEYEALEWQAAMEALILVATSGGPTMFARIGVMMAWTGTSSASSILAEGSTGTAQAFPGPMSGPAAGSPPIRRGNDGNVPIAK